MNKLKILIFLQALINWFSPQLFLIGFITKNILLMMFGIVCFIFGDFLCVRSIEKLKVEEKIGRVFDKLYGKKWRDVEV